MRGLSTIGLTDIVQVIVVSLCIASLIFILVLPTIEDWWNRRKK